MNPRRAWVIAAWSACIVSAACVVVRARYVTDLSAFLPAKPTPMQRLLVDQLREGPASRLILIALEGGDTQARAQVSAVMAQNLRRDDRFASVNNGDPAAAARDREFLFRHRYLLSESVDAQRFSAAGLERALRETVEDLASPAGLVFKSLVPHDPTGEMLKVIDQLAPARGPETRDGVWLSADGERTLLVAQTRAAGSDTDAQERALGAIRAAFVAARDVRGPTPPASQSTTAMRLKMSGPGVFAVAARAKIEQAAVRLSIISSLLVIAVLLAVYRSVPALILGLLPVATGALLGIAAVALGFGVVHGITLGFGITLIGESVDYSIYYFIQSVRRGPAAPAQAPWRRRVWPTLRLGMLTSVCGFASLLPSGFPGLAQLGLYSVSGLVAAAMVTRFVLPALLPRGLGVRDVAPFGLRVERALAPLRTLRAISMAGAALALASAALLALYLHRETLWNRELSALSPVSAEDLDYDARLRTDLGAANVLDLVIVSGADLQAVLRHAERVAGLLQPLIDRGIIAGFDSPANYLPSDATQAARRAGLPDGGSLRDRLRLACAALGLKSEQLAPFLIDVEAARHDALMTPQDLQGTSLAAGFGALILHQQGRWNALLPLHAAADGGRTEIDVARVGAALGAAPGEVHVLDLKAQSDALYSDYLTEAMRLSLAGLAAIVVLLFIVLRSPVRVGRVLAPLLLAVLCVAGGLALCGQHLTILHLVGMLLIVAVGSNYALFFDHLQCTPDERATAPLTLASLLIANLCTVIGFGLLSFSQVPVLVALGTTVAPGAFLALLFAAGLARSGCPAPAAAGHGEPASP